MFLNVGSSNHTSRVASINTSTKVPFNNSNTRPAGTFKYPSIPYEQHQKNYIEDECADADLVLGPAIKKNKSKTQVTVPIASNISNSLASAPSTSSIRLNSSASNTFSESKIPFPSYHRKRDRVSRNLSTVPPTNLNLPAPTTIFPPFV